MDKRIKRLMTVAACEQFAVNATKLGHPDLAEQTKLRILEVKAEDKGFETQAEKEALQAIFAYERVLSDRKGKATRATKAWPMISKYGIIDGVERVLSRMGEAEDYTALTEIDFGDFALEAVVLRHPDEFSEAAVETSRERMAAWGNA